MIEVTRDRIRIKDSLYGFNYECKISFKNCFYNDKSIVFCEESFKKRILLDERKRKLCLENGVTLIEWRYDEPVTKLELNKKLKNSGIEFED